MKDRFASGASEVNSLLKKLDRNPNILLPT